MHVALRLQGIGRTTGLWIPAYAGMTNLFHPSLRLHRIRWQQTRQPLVEVKEEGDAFGVRLVAFLPPLAS
jgi:hypothetical protein